MNYQKKNYYCTHAHYENKTSLLLHIEPENERCPRVNDSDSLQCQVSTSRNSLGTSFNSSPWNRNTILKTLHWRREHSLGTCRTHNGDWKEVQGIRLALKHTPIDREPSTSMKQATTQLCLHSQVCQFAGGQELQCTAQTKWTVLTKHFYHNYKKKRNRKKEEKWYFPGSLPDCYWQQIKDAQWFIVALPKEKTCLAGFYSETKVAFMQTITAQL